MVKVTPWSFSKLKAFDTCPKQFYHLKIARDYTEPETDALRLGSEVHEHCELYIRDNTPLPDEYKHFGPVLDALNSKTGTKLAEYKMGVTEELKPCMFDDDDVWWRGIVDLLIVDNELAWVVDYKTGKSTKYADTDQLELMALATFAHFPEVNKVRGGLLFLMAKELIRVTYKRAQREELWSKWMGKLKDLEDAARVDTWNAKPSGLCRKHCVVTECPHNGRS